MTNISITKKSGETEAFDAEKLKQPLVRSGASQTDAEYVTGIICKNIVDGMSTHKVYSQAYNLLRKQSGKVAGRYRLKKAIFDMGPTGYPFEILVGELIKLKGFTTQTGLVMDGNCVQHEVDVFATKIDKTIFVECKFHNDVRRKSDVKVALYVNSRFHDLKKKYEQTLRKIYKYLKTQLSPYLIGQTSNRVIEEKTGRFFLPPGTKITAENINEINFKHLNLENDLVEDEKVNEKIYNEIIYPVRSLIEEHENNYRKQRDRLRFGDELPSGVLKMVKIYIAKKRQIQVGDKLAGRHGNKGVIAKIAPIEDMPFMEDGTPVDIVLNPLGVPSRMNIGQILETHLGWAARSLGYDVETPVFDGTTIPEIIEALKDSRLPENGKVVLTDGKTGEPFADKITVGIIYMMKLNHLVVDKMHARSTGPYSMVTQQPLGGKAQHGGQRLGEMEVWALEAYGASRLLQEFLTIKSDDVDGRNATYEAITKGKELPEPGIPESFKVLVSELRSLGLDVELIPEQLENK